jgi:ATP-dependent DNA helicase RecG
LSIKLPINLTDLLRQRTFEGDRIVYKVGWNSDPIIHTCEPWLTTLKALGVVLAGSWDLE